MTTVTDYQECRQCGFLFVARYLSSEDDLLWAESWLRKELESGGVQADYAYLTRWREETKSVELVIKSLHEFQSDSNA